MARMVLRRPCWAKAVSLSKVMDLRSVGAMRSKTVSMTEMVSAAVLSNEPRRKRHTGFALMENEHGPCALADDEVALPMGGLGSGVDSLRPFMDGDPIFDRISRGPRSARTPAFVTAREITPKSFGLLVRAVDKGVDRLATHCPQTAFVSRFQPTRDLLGRPSFRKTVANESPQFLIFFDYGFFLFFSSLVS